MKKERWVVSAKRPDFQAIADPFVKPHHKDRNIPKLQHTGQTDN